jgi:hypothetical protein
MSERRGVNSMKKTKAVQPLPPPILTGRQVSRALGLPYNVAGVLQPTGVLDRTTVRVNGGPIRYTTHALPVVTLLQDMADAVEGERMSATDAGHALIAMVPAVLRAWNAVLRGGPVTPLAYSRPGLMVTFSGMGRAVAALRKITKPHPAAKSITK